MTRAATIAATVALLLAGACRDTAAPVADAPARARSTTSALAPARHADVLAIAQWLESVAVPTEHGVRWPVVPGEEPPRFERSLYSGDCGPILLFFELAQREARAPTRSAAKANGWLELARSGADELLESLPKKCSGEECGLYTGVAGYGFTLETAFRATGDAKYRDGALRCIDLLHASARLGGAGLDWSDTTDVISGTAGIGAFLLYMHEQERDLLALELATRAGRRLIELSQRESVGRSWRMDPSFPRVMPNFSHGTAGVAWFLAKLHAASSEPRFLDAARDGADYLLSIAERSDGGCRIHHDDPDGRDLYYLGWCHGPCGTSRLFSLLFQITGDAKYADALRGCEKTITASGLPQARPPGFWNNVGVCCGSAGVIEFLLAMARATGEPEPARLAGTIADDLLARGTRDGRGLRFVQAEHRAKPELLEAQSGWMQGASGIASALLDLDAFDRGEGPGIVLPDAR